MNEGRKLNQQYYFFKKNIIKCLPEGSRIALIMSSGYELSQWILECFCKNIVVIPISPFLSEEKKKFILSFSQSHAVIDENSKFTLLGKAPLSNLEDSFIIFSSGSTGDPKGIVLTKEAVMDNANTVAHLHNFTPSRGHATCLPLHHVNALMMSLLGTYIKKAPLSILSKFNSLDYFDLIERTNCRTASIVPALLDRLVNDKPRWPECLDYLITAAAPLSSILAKRFFDLYGPRVRQGYGLSEAVNFSFTCPLMSESEFIKEYIEKKPPVGLPLLGTEFRIINNEVQLRGKSIMRCYWNNQKATSEIFTNDGWLKTGDLGYMDNGYLRLSGRIKEVINRGGETIYPTDIEEEWTRQGVPNPFAAFRVHDERLCDDIGMCFEQKRGYAIENILKNSLYKPSVVIKTILKRTETGKIKRNEMGKNIYSMSTSEERYEMLLQAAYKTSLQILEKGIPNDTSNQVKFIYEECKKISKCKYLDHNYKLYKEDSPGYFALSILDKHWEDICNGCKGEDIVRQYPSFWKKLMTEWPMKDYALLTSNFMIKMGLLENKNIVELGAGVGNTSTLVASYIHGHYIRTDIFPDICKRTPLLGDVCYYDFNEPPFLENQDIVFAVNALHCAKDKRKTLMYINKMLKEGGILVAGEGMPNTQEQTPWALNAFFGLFDGWWDQGGFISRSVWLEFLESVGFCDWGYSVLRAGKHDLGGIFWAKK